SLALAVSMKTHGQLWRHSQPATTDKTRMPGSPVAITAQLQPHSWRGLTNDQRHAHYLGAIHAGTEQ
ncbi:hypothetical protein ACOI0Q_004939, partial [Yersinia enterocolitica]